MKTTQMKTNRDYSELPIQRSHLPSLALAETQSGRRVGKIYSEGEKMKA